jgi:hypothetical protein
MKKGNRESPRIGENGAVRWLGTLVLFAAMACGSSLGGRNSPAPVPCEDAVDGDPCGPNYQQCGPLDGYGCSKWCVAGTGVWSVNCVEPPTCASYPTIRQGLGCPTFPMLTCGPFAVDSLCGAVSATATCSPVGWAYDLPCDPDCESLDQADCKRYAGCAWVVPCANPNFPAAVQRCIDFPPRSGFCDPDPCPTGTTCVNAAVNPDDISSGDCTEAGLAVALCVAQ